MSFTDPLAQNTPLPDPMVAAAFSRPDSAVRVLAGTALAEWLTTEALPEALQALRPIWEDEAQTRVSAAAQAAADAATERFADLVRAATATRMTPTPDDADAPRTRHNVFLPAGTSQAVKSTAAARGLSLQDAITEALQAWLLAHNTTPEGA